MTHKSIRINDRTYPFHAVYHGTGSRILHNSKPIWIVKYYWRGGIQTVNFQVYYTTSPVNNSKKECPWTVDNKRIETPLGCGFSTLLEAIIAAEKFEISTNVDINRTGIDLSLFD